MSERKNINNLFQEKFENHEVMPEEFIWENIELKLKEKKKRRVIPFWWKLSGIAAALVIGFFTYNSLNTTNDNENSVVNQENNYKNVSKDSVNKNTNPVVINRSKTKNSDNSKTISGDNNVNNTIVAKETNSQSEKNNKTNSKVNKIDVKSNNRSNVANSEINKKPLVETDKIKSNSDSQLVSNSSKKDKNGKTSLKLSNINSNNEIAFDKNNDLKDKNKSNSTSNNEVLVQQETKEKEKNNSIDKVVSPSKENNSIVKNTTSERKTSVLTPKTDEPIIKKNDSTSIASVEPNALEELLIEKEKQTVTEQKINRWQVTSNVAPIYFSSTSNGSPLDSKLIDNDKVYSAENISYGIGVNYAVNKRVKIRTGINILNVDYDTNGILYYQTPTVSSKLSGLNPNVPGSLLVIESLSNVNTLFNRPIQKFEGSLNQKLGYIEMPLEVTYKILDKNFGIDLIGGMSTLVLNRNEIYLQSSELNLKIGEANNLNNVHFSGNLGLGLKYGFFKRLEARIEPVFKYQINTFNNDAGNFKPFVFGVYSGINYTF